MFTRARKLCPDEFLKIMKMVSQTENVDKEIGIVKTSQITIM